MIAKASQYDTIAIKANCWEEIELLKAVIFDMDGVIADTEPFHAKITAMVGEYYQLPITAESCVRFIGSTTRNMYETLLKESDSSLSPEEVMETDRRMKESLLQKEGYQAVPGALELIRHLYQQGIKLAIASSSTENDIKNVTESLGIQEYFCELVSGACLEHPKPAPDIFLLALERLNVSASEAVVIEDSANGVNAAAAAKLAVIGLLNPNSGNQNLIAASVLTDSLLYLDTAYIEAVLRRTNGESAVITSTKRLIIRELAEEDHTRLSEIYKNPEVNAFHPPFHLMETEKLKAYIKQIYPFYDFGLWGVYLRDSSLLVGCCGVENKMVDGKQEMELSYFLDRAYWDMGYGSECVVAVFSYAASVLDVPRLVAVIGKHNSRSIKLVSRLGMVQEKVIYHNGQDCYLYSIAVNNESS